MPVGTATKTVGEVLSRVKRLFGDESGAQLTDTDIINWINSGARDINNRFKLSKGIANVTTTIGTRTYNFPGVSIIAVDSLHYNGMPLEYKNFNEAKEYIARYDPKFEQVGTPIMWYEWGNEIYLYPTPDAATTLSLYYIGIPSEVSDAQDIIPLPDSYFETLIQYIMQQAYEMDDDIAASQNSQLRYDASLNVLSEDSDGSQRATYPVITETDEWMWGY